MGFNWVGDEMARVEAVLLDLEGTVVQMLYRFREAKRDVVNCLIQQCLPKDLFNPEDPTLKIFDKLRQYLDQTGKPHEFARLKRECEAIIDRYELEAAEGTSLIEGVVEALTMLRQAGLKIALVTNDGVKATQRILERFSLHPFFDSVVTREDVAGMKPSPEPILLALRRLSVLPENTVVVGDSGIDVEAARLAGVLAVGVTSGLKDEGALRSAGATHVISSVTRLPALIHEIDAAKD